MMADGLCGQREAAERPGRLIGYPAGTSLCNSDVSGRIQAECDCWHQRPVPRPPSSETAFDESLTILTLLEKLA